MIIDRITQPVQLSVFKRTPDNWVAIVWRGFNNTQIISGQDNIGEQSPMFSVPPEDAVWVTYHPHDVYIMTSDYGADLYIATLDNGEVEELIQIDLYSGQISICTDERIRRSFEFDPGVELRETVRRFLSKKAGYRELKEALR